VWSPPEVPQLSDRCAGFHAVKKFIILLGR